MSIHRLAHSIHSLTPSRGLLRMAAVAVVLSLIGIAGAARPADAATPLRIALTIDAVKIKGPGAVVSPPCTARVHVTNAITNQATSFQEVTFTVRLGSTVVETVAKTTDWKGDADVDLRRPTQANSSYDVQATAVPGKGAGQSAKVTCASLTNTAPGHVPVGTSDGTPPLGDCFPRDRTTIARPPCGGVDADISVPADVAPVVGP